tara:strand:+ start:313 stop:495 length:183 start_codon:yes stop_codon:yes gene_type:complete
MNRYRILKKMRDKFGNQMFVLMTDGYSEILEFDNEDKCLEMINILNANSDSGWDYEMVKS